MKTLKFLLLIAVTITISCTKNDDVIAPTPPKNTFLYPTTPYVFSPVEEDFLNGFLAKAELQYSSLTFDSSSYPFVDRVVTLGVVFEPLVDGKITTFNLKIPKTQIVSLEFGQISNLGEYVNGQIYIFSVNYGEKIKIPTGEIPIFKGRSYYLKAKTSRAYLYSNSINTPVSYPVTSGNIKISGSLFDVDIDRTYYNSYKDFGGDLSFSFLPNK